LSKVSNIIEISYANIERTKYYYPVIVQDVSTSGKNGILYSHSIVPIIILIEYFYDRWVMQKLLDKIENILATVSHRHLTNDTALYLLESWYLTFQIAYKQQGDNQVIRILQPYVPYFYGELETDLRKIDSSEFLAPICTPQIASVYSLMPFSLVGQIIDLIDKDSNSMQQFLDILNVLTTSSYTVFLARNQTFAQHIIAYYSDFLSQAFDNLEKGEPINKDTSFVLQVLLRLMLNLPIEEAPLVGTETELEVYARTPRHGIIKKLPKLLHKRLTDKHILIVPADFIADNDEGGQNAQTRIDCKLMSRVGPQNYRLQLGYICVNNKIELVYMDVDTIIEENIYKNVQAEHLSKFNSFF